MRDIISAEGMFEEFYPDPNQCSKDCFRCPAQYRGF